MFNPPKELKKESEMPDARSLKMVWPCLGYVFEIKDPHQFVACNEPKSASQAQTQPAVAEVIQQMEV